MSITAMALVAAAKNIISEIDIETTQASLPEYLILDVREPTEYATGCLPNAINIPRGVLEFKISSHPAFKDKQDANIIVYCLTGGRSALATEALNKIGYNHAVSMAGGLNAWSKNGLQITQP